MRLYLFRWQIVNRITGNGAIFSRHKNTGNLDGDFGEIPHKAITISDTPFVRGFQITSPVNLFN